jgi:hypothetical protein
MGGKQARLQKVYAGASSMAIHRHLMAALLLIGALVVMCTAQNAGRCWVPLSLLLIVCAYRPQHVLNRRSRRLCT